MFGDCAAALSALAHIAKMNQGLAAQVNAQTGCIRSNTVWVSRKSCRDHAAQGTAQPGHGIN
jgi:hypothetical protein